MPLSATAAISTEPAFEQLRRAEEGVHRPLRIGRDEDQRLRAVAPTSLRAGTRKSMPWASMSCR